MIVVEGPDNSGKSTFARQFGLPYFSAGPAPKSPSELDDCIHSQRDRISWSCIQDRLTCISHQVYSEDSTRNLLQAELDRLIDYPGFIVVYCRPPERVLMNMSTHKVKSYDTEESLQKIINNQHIYIQRYDALMAKTPHVMYDYTDPDIDLKGLIRILLDSQEDESVWRAVRHQLTAQGVAA